MPDSDVLIGFAFGIKKRNYRRIHPINTAVLRAIAKFAFPDLAGGDRGPQIANELLRVITGVDNAVVLTQQFFPRVFRDATKLVVDVINDSALIGDRDNRGLVERKLDISKLLERTLKRIAVSRLALFAILSLCDYGLRISRGPNVRVLESASSFSRSGGTDFFQLLHTITKLVAGNVQELCGFGLISAAPLQRLTHQRHFNFFQRDAVRR